MAREKVLGVMHLAPAPDSATRPPRERLSREPVTISNRSSKAFGAHWGCQDLVDTGNITAAPSQFAR